MSIDKHAAGSDAASAAIAPASVPFAIRPRRAIHRQSDALSADDRQTTISNPVRFSHRGFLTGRPASIRLRPAPPGTGIVFNESLPARVRHARIENHFVHLSNGRETVLAVEHLLAACYGLGIDNLQVDVTGEEVPFGDGSALPFVRILLAAGLRHQTFMQSVQRLNEPIVAYQDDRFICALPAPTGRPALTTTYFIRFPELEPSEQHFDWNMASGDFSRALASARTFGYQPHGGRLPDWLGPVASRPRGDRRTSGTETLVLSARPRFPDEPVRHKTLDLLGDLCLLGRRLHAHVFAYKAGHRLHHKLVSELEEKWT